MLSRVQYLRQAIPLFHFIQSRLNYGTGDKICSRYGKLIRASLYYQLSMDANKMISESCWVYRPMRLIPGCFRAANLRSSILAYYSCPSPHSSLMLYLV